jgi:solute carrier family 31 (copper transporter), member 1
MDMDDGSTNTTVMSMMVPWFHTQGGDNLLFQSWQPTSPGAIAGASIVLVAIALFERWLSASRGVLETYWRTQ